jgi:hypothetical protein
MTPYTFRTLRRWGWVRAVIAMCCSPKMVITRLLRMLLVSKRHQNGKEAKFLRPNGDSLVVMNCEEKEEEEEEGKGEREGEERQGEEKKEKEEEEVRSKLLICAKLFPLLYIKKSCVINYLFLNLGCIEDIFK